MAELSSNASGKKSIFCIPHGLYLSLAKDKPDRDLYRHQINRQANA
jgi:hypothetical protein